MIEAKFLESWGSDTTPAYAAWVSTGRDIDRSSEEALDLVERLAHDGHTSCFEHMGASFEIHVPIFIARQIMRHRIGFSYNELSGRYKDFRDQDCYLPELEDDNVKKFIAEHFDESIKKYESMRSAGVSREVARYVLPLNTMTRIRMTGNLRAWSHFVKLRDSSHAQYEIRILAQKIKAKLRELWPVSSGALL